MQNFPYKRSGRYVCIHVDLLCGRLHAGQVGIPEEADDVDEQYPERSRYKGEADGLNRRPHRVTCKQHGLEVPL